MDSAKIKNNLVVNSNDLVHAKYDLSLWQKRVFVYAISQLEKERTTFEPIRMNIRDIIKFFKASDGTLAYNAIMEAPKSLDRTIEIPYITEKGYLRYGVIRLIQRYTIPADANSENQYIEIEFNDALKPHLLELKEKFLKYDISNVIELQSTYSFRMYEILKSHEYQKSVEFDIEYLRDVLEVHDIYKAYKDFKRRIINKAQEDLTKFCDIHFTYDEKKGVKGKKIQSLLFHIHKNDTANRTTSKTKKGAKHKKTDKEDESSIVETVFVPSQSIIESDKEQLIVELSPIVVVKFGVSLKVFMALMDQHTEGDIKQAIKVTEQAVAAGKVGNVAGFFVEAVRAGYVQVEQKKKQVESEKKAKIQEASRVEAAAQKQISDDKKIRHERDISLLKQLIEADKTFELQLIERVSTGLMGTFYKKDKSFEENMSIPLVMAGVINAAKELRPDKFSN